MVDILPHWNWEIHKSYQQVVDKYEDILVGVYSNALSVEVLQWRIPERKDLPGKRSHLVEDRIVAAGKPAKIGLRSERSQLDAYGQDLLYLYFGFLDQDENWVPSVFNQLHFYIEELTWIMGVDNDRQASSERYQAQKIVTLKARPSMAENLFWFRV